MPRFLEELTEEQKVQRHISAMDDSLNLINRLIEEGVVTDNVCDNIERNYRHLEIMLEKDMIQNSGENLTRFQTVITQAKTFIAK